ncbi:MAG: hypothetical protein FJW34_09795 [Acidobacteria bacterium]|nr:hypothetical protein [Acidobacteriota bacterium]
MAAVSPHLAQVEPEAVGRYLGGRRRHLWSRAALPAAGTLGHADVRVAARYAHIVNPAGRNPALFIPVKVV